MKNKSKYGTSVTLKNFNHWISYLRALAIKAKVFNEGDDEPMTQKQVNELFNKERFKEKFYKGLSPEEAFQEEMEEWASGFEMQYMNYERH